MATIEEYLKEVDKLAKLKQSEGYTPSIRSQFLANFYDSIWINEPNTARKIFLLLLKQYTEKRIYFSQAKKTTQKTIQSILEEVQASYKTESPDKLPRIIEKINAKKNELTLKGSLACLLSAYVTRFPGARAYFCEDIQKALTLPKVEDEKIQPEESKAAAKINIAEMPIEEKIEEYKKLCDTPDNMTDTIDTELFHHIKVTSDGNLYSKKSLDDLFARRAAEHKSDPQPSCIYNRKKLSKKTDYQDAKELDAICHEFDIEQKTIMLIIDELPGVSDEDVMASITRFQQKRDALSKRFAEKHEEIKNNLLRNKIDYFKSMVPPIPDMLLCHKSKAFLTEPVINNECEVVNLSSLQVEKVAVCETLKAFCESYQRERQSVVDAIKKFKLGTNEEEVVELIERFNAESQLIISDYVNAKISIIGMTLSNKAEDAFRVHPEITDLQIRYPTKEGTYIISRPYIAKIYNNYAQFRADKTNEFTQLFQTYQRKKNDETRKPILNAILNLLISVTQKTESFYKQYLAAKLRLFHRAVAEFTPMPHELFCPRTRKLLIDPVLLPSGEIVSFQTLTDDEIETKKCQRLPELAQICKYYREQRGALLNKRLYDNVYKTKSNSFAFETLEFPEEILARCREARNTIKLESKSDNSLVSKAQIINNLKLDIKNESHLVFWSQQVSKKYCGHGGTTVTFRNIDGSVRNYNVPKRVYKMMQKAGEANRLTLNQFIRELEGARASRSGLFRNPLAFRRKAEVVEKVYSVGNDIRVLRV